MTLRLMTLNDPFILSVKKKKKVLKIYLICTIPCTHSAHHTQGESTFQSYVVDLKLICQFLVKATEEVLSAAGCSPSHLIHFVSLPTTVQRQTPGQSGKRAKVQLQEACL